MTGVPYIEDYTIANMHLGIEDYKQPSKHHFFPRLSHKRFSCWAGGGGLGESDTIEGARQILFDYAIEVIDKVIYELNEKLFINLHAKRTLNDNVLNIKEFNVSPQ